MSKFHFNGKVSQEIRACIIPLREVIGSPRSLQGNLIFQDVQ